MNDPDGAIVVIDGRVHLIAEISISQSVVLEQVVYEQEHNSIEEIYRHAEYVV
jgi:hypothetical protein